MLKYLYHVYKMFNISYNVFSYLRLLVTKMASHHGVTRIDTRTQFRVQNICYTIIPDKQILWKMKNIQDSVFPF
jgi:hypothetical protein